MVLSDRTIKEELAKGRIVISPLDPEDIQPASVDLHLDGSILVFTNSRIPYIDVKKGLEDLTPKVPISPKAKMKKPPTPKSQGQSQETSPPK